MGREESANEDDTDTETVGGEVTESEESVSTNKMVQFFAIPFHKLSYKRLPKRCLKPSFLALNGAAFLAGLTAIIISSWMLADGKLMSRLIGQRLFVTILLLIGAFVTLVSLIGILGFVKRRRKFLLVYLTCHSLSLCTIFVCAIMSFPLFDKVTRRIRGDMLSSIVNYRTLDWATEAWDNTHAYLKCCGVDSYQDWAKYRKTVPQSCCSASLEECHPMTDLVIYKHGCWRGAVLFLKSHVRTVSMSALCTSVFLLASLYVALGAYARLERARARIDDRD